MHRDGFEDLHDLRKERVRHFTNDEERIRLCPETKTRAAFFGQPGFSAAAHGFRQLSV
jgi:hypothetical protein